VSKRTPDGPPPPPTVQRVRLRYTKRGRLRFTSHRDIARAFERALRRAEVPMAYSAGFSPHPKISWVGAAPTGVASEAEYVEIGLAEHRDLEELKRALDESLPAGIDIVEAVDAPVGTSLPDRIEASQWQIKLPGLEASAVLAAAGAFLAADEVPVERLTKGGMRTLDARAAVVSMRVEDGSCAILHLVVRHVTPAVRPDDVLSGLRIVADLVPPVPPEATRYAQGPLTETGEVGDPLAPDRQPPAPGATRQDADRDEATVGG
jgi:radical SAM-linked protein